MCCRAAGESPDRSRRFKEHLPARRARGGEERRGQLRVCPGLLLPNGRDPARKEANEPGRGRSASPSQLGDLRRSGREGRTAARPSSLREEGPRACRPPRGGGGSGSGGRPRLRPAGPQGYEEAEVPGLCSRSAPRDPPAARARRREAFRGRTPAGGDFP